MTTEVDGGTIRHTIGPDGSFSLRAISGTVRLRGTQAGDVVVHARTGAGEAPALAVRRYEGGLHVEPERRGMTILGASIGLGEPEVHFDVELPANARLELNSVSAEVDGSGLHGDQSYRVVSGELVLSDAGGRLTAKSVSGGVRVFASRPAEVDIVTTSGTLEVEGPLEVVRLRSVSGDVSVGGRLAAGPEHRVDTVSGDLHLTVEGGLTVEASGPIVALRSTISGRSSSRHGQRGFVIGDGAAQLRFRSMSGEVSIEEYGSTGARPIEPVRAGQPRQGRRPDPLEILRAVERGELSVEEASRLLEEEPEDA